MSIRTLCLWCADWPVEAARQRGDAPRGAPVAVVEHGRVLSASSEARVEGVVEDLRRREAETRCPGIVVLDADPTGDARTFEPVARAVEALSPRLVLDRPGVVSFPTRGPSRYFGGDDALAAHVRDAVTATGTADTGIGIADSAFAARIAARSSQLVERGATREFLAPWSVSVLGDPDLADLLCRLGLHTLGAFAALPSPDVLARFGSDGLAAHRLARGEDEHPPVLTVPPPDLVERCELDPPADRVDVAAFAAKALADRLLEQLAGRGLACTQVIVEAETEHGECLARAWRHEGALTPAALAERVRWQLDGWLTTTGGLSGGLTVLRLIPDQVIPASGRQLKLWGGDAAAADRAARVLARVQGMLGPDHVTTPVLQGGRVPAERVRWVPWGEQRSPARSVGAAWPGAIPGPAPARIIDPPAAAELLGPDGRAVVVGARGEASSAPAALRCDLLPDDGGAVTSWAGPWAHDVRWWDRRARSRRVYWQVVLGDVACLVAVARATASLEAIYD
jgi:protein ImuB